MSAPARRAWVALAQATRREVPRVPFRIDGAEVGSVAAAHLPVLRELGPTLDVQGSGVALVVPADRRDTALAQLNQALRGRGLIRAWRDEPYPLPDPATQRVLAVFERASSRFWGTLTYGAHATGWVQASDGSVRLWIAQRSFDKATDPGAYDNLVGGGVPHGQSPDETLVREGWEEAGLTPDVMRRARRGRVIRLHRDIPEGLQHEWIHAYDVQLQDDERPVNQDGEVHAFSCLPADEALDLAAGTSMTADAALVTLDFALRHGVLPPPEQAALEARAAGLWVPA